MELRLVHGTPAAHCAAIRAGELDLALVRGPVRGPGLRTVELWREPLHAVLPASHPAAAAPALHDTVLAACHDAGFVPCLGRPMGSAQDTVVEIGASRDQVTIVYGEPGPVTAGIAIRPLDPPLTVPGHLVAPATGADECLAALTAAFS